ncbi:hypothetical protein [Kitasatospora viridis]|uniref:Uncharacterized protein n=1 Tax=Kitasatospora viridis TaxID=281105 RepID=A0A561UKL6_9ACTN|nr:hypothetical protein [Kitasatospora viridis]TWF99902.1 hypothetical protein FHX73_113762 [Kitasatospora viridis]
MTTPPPATPDVPQYQLLRDTGNGPTTPDEQAILHAEFGAPDARGVYGAPTTTEETTA